MTHLSSALVTPSYWLDHERCKLLVRSVERYVPRHVKHYLLIEKRDLELFRPMQSNRTQIIVVQDLVPGWIIRVPGFNKGWISLRSLPIRNWIMQQIVKLSVPLHLTEDVLVYVDSDAFFVRPFDPADLFRQGKVPLFLKRGESWRNDYNNVWHGVAARMLGLPEQKVFDTEFIGQIITWRRDVVPKLHAHIEKTMGMSWQMALTRQSVFAEYILYGLFCERILGIEAAGHWEDGIDRTQCYWETKPLDLAGLVGLRDSLLPEHHSVMVSAKSGTPIESVRKAFIE